MLQLCALQLTAWILVEIENHSFNFSFTNLNFRKKIYILMLSVTSGPSSIGQFCDQSELRTIFFFSSARYRKGSVSQLIENFQLYKNPHSIHHSFTGWKREKSGRTQVDRFGYWILHESAGKSRKNVRFLHESTGNQRNVEAVFR